MQTGIAFGLTAALCWGIADFCARWATRAAGTFRTLLVVQVVGIAGLLAVGLPLGLFRLAGAPLGLVFAAVGISLVILAGAGLLYRALAIGTLALVSPIAASFAAVTALLALAAGERVAPVALVGIVLTLIGVVIASTVPAPTSGLKSGPKAVPQPAALVPPRRRFAPGLGEALGAMLLFGAGYWLLDFVAPALGGVTVALIGKLADFVALGALALALPLVRLARPKVDQERDQASRDSSDAPIAATGFSAQFWLFVIPVGLLDTAANVAYNLGISVAQTSIVVVLSSLFSAVTVLLAWIFLRERLAGWQWAGVAAILVGILLVNAF